MNIVPRKGGGNGLDLSPPEVCSAEQSVWGVGGLGLQGTEELGTQDEMLSINQDRGAKAAPT